MNSTQRIAVLSSLLIVFASAGVTTATDAPQAVSPGSLDRYATLRDGCGTFTWQEVEGATGYELVVYEVMGEMATDTDIDPGQVREVFLARIPGGASAWTPEAAQCLAPGGRYAWFVRAVFDGHTGEATEWSEPKFLMILATPTEQEVEHALTVLRRYLEEDQQPTGHGAEVFDEAVRKAAAKITSKSVQTGITAITGEQSNPAGETYGVIGISSSPDGAGIGAANTAGGADLVLDGSAQGAADAELSEAGIDRPSAGAETFEITNTGAGTMTLQVDGVDVVTTATDQDTPPRDPGNQLNLTGNVLDVVEGAGSGLDADLLDGNEASAFSPDGHTHTGYLSTSGGTLTGTLSVQDHLQVTGITYDYFVQEAFGGTYDGSPGGVWVDIVTVPNRLPVLYEVVIVTHDFGWRTGYYVWHAFLGENTSATSIDLVSSYEYPETGTPIDPTLQWNGTTLQWEWQVNVCCNALGPRVTVKAREILGTYDTP